MTVRASFALARPFFAAGPDTDPGAWAEWEARIDAARAADARDARGRAVNRCDLRAPAAGETTGDEP